MCWLISFVLVAKNVYIMFAGLGITFTQENFDKIWQEFMLTVLGGNTRAETVWYDIIPSLWITIVVEVVVAVVVVVGCLGLKYFSWSVPWSLISCLAHDLDHEDPITVIYRNISGVLELVAIH